MNDAWEQVLAAVEEDARRAEELLNAEDSTLSAFPFEVMLNLPPLADMPPVPAELRARIVALRDHIDELQRLLSTAVSSWQDPRRVPLIAAATPRFIDRRI